MPGTARGLRAALKSVHSVWWLNLAIWAAAIALFAGPVDDLPLLHEPQIAWWWLALGFLIGERCVVHLEFSRNAHSFSLGDVPLVFGLVLATGHDLVIAAVVGPALTLLLDRRLPPIKLFFNLGQFASMCPTCVLTGGMIRAGGTSMAAPMVAGAAALLLERNPNLTPDQVKGILVESARTLPGGLPGLDTYTALKRADWTPYPVANRGLTPNPLVSAATGEIDYTRSSWSRSSWSNATGAQSADWSRSSWSRSSWSSYDSSGVQTSRSSWSRSSWSTSWTK